MIRTIITTNGIPYQGFDQPFFEGDHITIT